MQNLIHPERIFISQRRLCSRKVTSDTKTYSRIVFSFIGFYCYELTFRIITLNLSFYLADDVFTDTTSSPFLINGKIGYLYSREFSFGQKVLID